MLSSRRNWIVLLSALAFLVVSAFGTHIHLCFDGQEPAASVHLMDSDHHVGESTTHDDLDVDPLGKPLPKPFKIELPGLALLLACVFLSLSTAQPIPATPRRSAPALLLPRYWRPLLRAPPL